MALSGWEPKGHLSSRLIIFATVTQNPILRLETEQRKLKVQNRPNMFLAKPGTFDNGIKVTTLHKGLIFGLNSSSEDFHWDCGSKKLSFQAAIPLGNIHCM